MAPLLVTRPGIVVPVPVDPLGVDGPTRAQARGPFWRRVAPGYYVPAWVDGSRVEQRIVEAIAALPPGTAATGWAAFAWILARWFPGTGPDGTLLPVPAALGNQRTARKRPGVELSEDWLFADDVVVVDGLPVTVPLRSVSHIARTARTDLAATQAIDMAAFNDLVSIDELACYVDRLGARPGTRRLRRALEAADENAWSPQEVRMRLDWKAARPEATLLCNRPVFDLAGNHLFTPDLFDAAAAVAGEYNGGQHGEGQQFSRDLTREELARRLGIEMVTGIAGAGERGRFLDRLAGGYQRQSSADSHGDDRTWTIEPPEWWIDTSTVAARRALPPYLRERWLQHRRAPDVWAAISER